MKIVRERSDLRVNGRRGWKPTSVPYRHVRHISSRSHTGTARRVRLSWERQNHGTPERAKARAAISADSAQRGSKRSTCRWLFVVFAGLDKRLSTKFSIRLRPVRFATSTGSRNPFSSRNISRQSDRCSPLTVSSRRTFSQTSLCESWRKRPDSGPQLRLFQNR